MKVLIAIDSFKGSVSSLQGSEAISLGIRDVYKDADIVTIPLADGGEGTVESLIHMTNGYWVEKAVTGPLGEKVNAKYGISRDGKTALLEMASASGITLVPADQLNPYKTTTYGVGEIIIDAIERGCRNFVIGIGGSATNDAGIGMLQALGFQFKNAEGMEVGYGGSALADVDQIITENAHPLLAECNFQIACDVNNPFYGKNGAAYIFGPQKGASNEMVKVLDEGLKHFATKVLETLNVDLQSIEGAGAAGGLGGGLAGFLQAKLQSGIELILNEVGMEEQLSNADYVITGEGMLDGQTSMGKAPIGVAQLAEKHEVPVIALAGGINQENFQLNDHGMTACFSIMTAPMTLERAMNADTALQNLRFTTNQLFRLIKASSN